MERWTTKETDDGLYVVDENGDKVCFPLGPQSRASLIAAAPKLRTAVEHVLIASEDGGDMDDIDWNLLREALADADGEGTGHWIDDLDDPYGLLEDDGDDDLTEEERLEDARDEAADLKLRNMKYDEAGL